MRVHPLHSWQVSPAAAQELQRRLAPRVVRQSCLPQGLRYVAGVDLSPPDPQGRVRAAAVVLSWPELAVCEVKTAEGISGFPYIPGLLSFREAPLVLRALERVELAADVLLVDGQGLAHPRRFGLACHIGLALELPTVGCAKSILLGSHSTVPEAPGSRVDLLDDGEVVGTVVRTRQGANPLYVSIGHKVDLEGAVRLVLACCRGHRLPAPTRLAHEAAAGRLPEQGPSPRVAAGQQGALF